MSQRLKNKVAVITGGGTGIGLATAKLFVEEGAKVAITGRTKASLDKAAAVIGDNILAVPGDVSDISSLQQVFDTVAAKWGKIDIVMANAAAYLPGPIADYTEAMFDKTSNINFKGTFFTVQKALPHLNEGASIILVSSAVTEKGVPEHGAYAASKAAVRALATSFSAELLPRKIRVNALTPGPTDTPVFEQVATKEEAAKMSAAMAEFTPVKRLGRPEELAAAALYLASDESAFMVGSELLIDGGFRTL